MKNQLLRIASLGIITLAILVAGTVSVSKAQAKHNDNQCDPGYNYQDGHCVHNGDGNGNCGQNQGIGNNGNDNGYGNNGDCVTPSVTPTPTPEHHNDCDDNKVHDEGWYKDHKDCVTPTPESTPTPTPTEAPSNPGNPGGPGDGRSDGRSDGLSSCPSCTQAPQGQVLGATTEFAGTGVADELIMNVVGALGGLSTASGLVLAAKKKFIK